MKKQRRNQPKKTINLTASSQGQPNQQPCLLTIKERKKCLDKFQQIKAIGNTMISLVDLRECLKSKYKQNLEYGRYRTEQQLLEIIQEGDSKGHGYISYEAFENLVEKWKVKQQNEDGKNLGLVFDQILKSEQDEHDDTNITTISEEYLQKFFRENFQLQIDLLLFKTLNSQIISREDFKQIFS